MTKIAINLDKEELKVLSRRAKRNFLTLTEQIEDIVRRSCLNYKGKTSSSSRMRVDDALVGIFSREQRGRPRKKW